MRNSLPTKLSQQGSSTLGTLIWLAVIVSIGLIIKGEVFPSISVGDSAGGLSGKFGQPISKTAIPRPR